MDSEKYLKIRLNSLYPKLPVPFDLFVQVSGKFIHYLKAGDQLAAAKIEKFEKTAPDQFCILAKDLAAYKKYVRDLMDSNRLPSGAKAIILRESSLALIEELFESPDIEKALNESKAIIDDFIRFMDQDADAMSHLIGLSSHDFYTYNHSLDVGIYSLGLGYAVGYRGSELKELGQGALFHDIGKRHVDVDIITKKGPLDDLEWAQMQRHPQFGLEIMQKFDVSDAIIACCFEHHESFVGNGYPQQLTGEQIHPMARIVAITDTYDALTTKRSYNSPMTPTNALSFMRDKLAARYDQDMLKALLGVLFKMQQKIAG